MNGKRLWYVDVADSSAVYLGEFLSDEAVEKKIAESSDICTPTGNFAVEEVEINFDEKNEPPMAGEE